MHKLSTTRVNVMGVLSCVHSPVVVFAGCYPCGTRFGTRELCAIWPDCGSPYIPLVNLTNIYLLWTLSHRMYAFMNSLGIIYVWILKYSARSMIFLR